VYLRTIILLFENQTEEKPWSNSAQLALNKSASHGGQLRKPTSGMGTS